MNLILLPLIVLACLSPVLTLLRLWQVKEWRWDRLCEHVKREGVVKQLFGSLRPTIFGIWMLIATVSIFLQDPVFVTLRMCIELLIVLALLSGVQLASKKQPLPVFTSKAILMFCVSIGILTMFSLALMTSLTSLRLLLLALTPFLCPVWVLSAWILTKPLDAALKMRLLNEAMRMRERYPNLTVIGITGSVGKTTTKELLAHVLKKRGAVATPAHVNTELGVSSWLLRALKDKPSDWKGTLIIEMGAYRTGEIKLLCDIAKPHIGIITFIGSQHLALFGSIEAIRDAKGELFRSIPAHGRAFLNHDNAMSSSLRSFCRCSVTSVGTDGKADLNALDIEETAEGLTFKIEGTEINIPVAGTHTVTSILFAIGVAKHLGMNLAEISRELATFKPLDRSFQLKTIRGVTVLDDTYNSSPDSFRAAVSWAAQQPHAVKTLLIDGIIELGASEATVHAELSKEASKVFNRVIICNARFLPYFRDNGFGDRAQLLSNSPNRLTKNSLLVCIGRVPRTAIDELLPA